MWALESVTDPLEAVRSGSGCTAGGSNVRPGYRRVRWKSTHAFFAQDVAGPSRSRGPLSGEVCPLTISFTRLPTCSRSSRLRFPSLSIPSACFHALMHRHLLSRSCSSGTFPIPACSDAGVAARGGTVLQCWTGSGAACVSGTHVVGDDAGAAV